MPVIDQKSVPLQTGSSYPEPYNRQMVGRSSKWLGKAAGLTQFGANLVILAPGAMSSQRHWHLREDEFLVMTKGELVLVEDQGETVMRPGDCAAFPAGVPNGHHLVNRSDAEAQFVVVGSDYPNEVCTYSDIDMMVTGNGDASHFTHKDGSPMPKAD